MRNLQNTSVLNENWEQTERKYAPISYPWEDRDFQPAG